MYPHQRPRMDPARMAPRLSDDHDMSAWHSSPNAQLPVSTPANSQNYATVPYLAQHAGQQPSLPPMHSQCATFPDTYSHPHAALNNWATSDPHNHEYNLFNVPIQNARVQPSSIPVQLLQGLQNLEFSEHPSNPILRNGVPRNATAQTASGFCPRIDNKHLSPPFSQPWREDTSRTKFGDDPPSGYQEYLTDAFPVFDAQNSNYASQATYPFSIQLPPQSSAHLTVFNEGRDALSSGTSTSQHMGGTIPIESRRENQAMPVTIPVTSSSLNSNPRENKRRTRGSQDVNRTNASSAQQESNLETDRNTQEGSKPVVGTDAGRRAAQERSTREPTFFCTYPGCPSTFTRKHNLNLHLDSHQRKSVTCPRCQTQLVKSSLTRHVKTCETRPLPSANK